MTNYIDLIANYYPETICVATDPYDYSTIQWESASIAQADLDVVALVDYKTNKIMLFSDYATNDITSGFVSSALGFPHGYDAQPEDQINLIGAVTSQASMPYACYAATVGYQDVDFGGEDWTAK